ncbi:uncharacterized protein OCT59_005538 [Rhizophagus irregularis]|uniref:Uncharacterized protein n=1 Tax=Rhizophagus irregularis TaxID=588596 RepID=A0A916E1U1_9GLOM|nr:hypothetical protein OCT59_005538 [Rhizophagus irregularis]CAB5174988.1 unnamed protein product [Rhizophagus irregularis]CAB5334565.1 unnamed protein product [Rhizophagus irregularis]
MSDMSDELLSLRHERALELLQKPEIKEFFEDRNKRFINITALKEWEEAGEPFEILASLEYMKREAHKIGVSSGSFSNVTGTGGCNSANGRLEVCLRFIPTITRRPGRCARLILPPVTDLPYTRTINIVIKILN